MRESIVDALEGTRSLIRGLYGAYILIGDTETATGFVEQLRKVNDQIREEEQREDPLGES